MALEVRINIGLLPDGREASHHWNRYTSAMRWVLGRSSHGEIGLFMRLCPGFQFFLAFSLSLPFFCPFRIHCNCLRRCVVCWALSPQQFCNLWLFYLFSASFIRISSSQLFENLLLWQWVSTECVCVRARSLSLSVTLTIFGNCLCRNFYGGWVSSVAVCGRTTPAIIHAQQQPNGSIRAVSIPMPEIEVECWRLTTLFHELDGNAQLTHRIGIVLVASLLHGTFALLWPLHVLFIRSNEILCRKKSNKRNFIAPNSPDVSKSSQIRYQCQPIPNPPEPFNPPVCAQCRHTHEKCTEIRVRKPSLNWISWSSWPSPLRMPMVPRQKGANIRRSFSH